MTREADSTAFTYLFAFRCKHSPPRPPSSFCVIQSSLSGTDKQADTGVPYDTHATIPQRSMLRPLLFMASIVVLSAQPEVSLSVY